MRTATMSSFLALSLSADPAGASASPKRSSIPARLKRCAIFLTAVCTDEMHINGPQTSLHKAGVQVRSVEACQCLKKPMVFGHRLFQLQRFLKRASLHLQCGKDDQQVLPSSCVSFSRQLVCHHGSQCRSLQWRLNFFGCAFHSLCPHADWGSCSRKTASS